MWPFIGIKYETFYKHIDIEEESQGCRAEQWAFMRVFQYPLFHCTPGKMLPWESEDFTSPLFRKINIIR